MVKATFTKNQADRYQNVLIEGHALFDSLGKDIVCAAISGQVVMLELGLLGVVFSETIIQKEIGRLHLQVSQDKETQILIQSFHFALQAVENEYPNHLQIVKDL